MQLNDGHDIPPIGLGTVPLKGAQAEMAVSNALDTGYRLIDTAVNYQNEEAVGQAIARSSVARESIFVTTKIPGRHHGYNETLASFEDSRTALGLDYLDLYLIHWPNPSVDKYVETWRAMIDLRRAGYVKSIGVCNFTETFLARLLDETGVVPAVNQIELHPFFPQRELRTYHSARGIVTEAWGPLGRNAPVLSSEPVLTAARNHTVTPAQVVLRWHVQLGTLPIPKSADQRRQAQNLDVFSFELQQSEMEAISALGRPDGRIFNGDPNVHEEM